MGMAAVTGWGGAAPVERAAGEAGLWTADQVRARLEDAMETLRRMRCSANSWPAGYRSGWPDFVRDYFEAYGADAPRGLRAAPSPAAIRRFDEAMPWVFLVPERRHQKAMLLKAVPLSWRKVGKLLDVDHKTAQRWGEAAIDSVVKALNHKMGVDRCPKTP